MKAKAESPISFLRPECLLNAEEEYAIRKFMSGNLPYILDKAISELVKRQIDSGLEVISEGGLSSDKLIARFLDLIWWLRADSDTYWPYIPRPKWRGRNTKGKL